MFLIPSSETAIVALTKSLPLSDPTDFVGRLIISVDLNESPLPDFVSQSKLVQQVHFNAYQSLVAHLEKGKIAKPPSQPLTVYEGDHLNSLGNCFLLVRTRDEGLFRAVQGLKFTTYLLKPHDGHTFY